MDTLSDKIMAIVNSNDTNSDKQAQAEALELQYKLTADNG